MKKTNSELYPCKEVVMSREFSRDFQEEFKLFKNLSKRNLEKNSVWILSMDIFIAVLQI